MDVLIKDQYGIDLPNFIHEAANLKDAQQAAQRNAKFLLVYLHCGDHPNTKHFLKHILSAAEAHDLVQNQLMLWAVDTSTAEGYKLSFQLQATTFPFVTVGLKKNFIMDLQGDFTLSDFITHTKRAIESGAPVMAREVAFVADRESRNRLREMQEQELEDARKKDLEARNVRQRAKEEAERAAKEAAEKAAAEEAERKKQAEAEEAERLKKEAEEDAKKNEAEQAKALALSMLPEDPEPHTPATEKATIRLVSIKGNQHEKEFLRSAPISSIYHYATSREDFEGQKFYLVAGFPPKRIDKSDEKCIGDDKNLFPRAVVNMREEQ